MKFKVRDEVKVLRATYDTDCIGKTKKVVQVEGESASLSLGHY